MATTSIAQDYNGNSNSNSNSALISTSSSLSDALSDYIISIVLLLLSADSKSEISRSIRGGDGVDDANYSLITRFANEQTLQSIYINKIRVHQIQSSSSSRSLAEEEGEGYPVSSSNINATSIRNTHKYKYTITTNLTWHQNNVASLALIKTVPTIDYNRSIAEQIHVLNLFGPALSSAAAASTASSTSGGNNDLSSNASGTAGKTRSAPIIDDENGENASRSAASSSNPYESLHSIVHLAVQPYFEAYISRKHNASIIDGEQNGDPVTTGSTNTLDAARKSSNNNGGLANTSTTGTAGNNILGNITASASSTSNKAKINKDNDASSSNTGIPIAKKKFAELELSLLHLQQNVEIPEIVLGVHPVVMRAVEKVGL